MSLLKRSIFTDIASALAILSLILLTLMWTEARKDVIYLCNNVHVGVSKIRVIGLLNTYRFIRFTDSQTPSGSKIVADSWLHFGMYNCTVRFGVFDQVVQKEFGQ